MKNAIYIDIDSDRENTPILFSKPPHIPQPTTKEEAKVMILNDITSLSEALKFLIIVAADNNYANGDELVNAASLTIKDALITLQKTRTNEHSKSTEGSTLEG